MYVLCRLHGLQASILLCDTGIRHIWTRQLIPERGPTRIRGSIRMRPYCARVIVFTCWFSRITMIIPAVVRLITQRFIFNTSHEDAVLRSFCSFTVHTRSCWYSLAHSAASLMASILLPRLHTSAVYLSTKSCHKRAAINPEQCAQNTLQHISVQSAC